MEIKVIYENENILVVNKPSGLVVHPARPALLRDGKTQEPALTDWIIAHYPEVEGVGEDIILKNGDVIKRPGIVHRIDRETSGVLVVAKHQKSFLALKKLFQEQAVAKHYKAIVYGNIKDTVGVIEKEIGRSKKDFRRRSTRSDARGVLREARTEYHVTLRKGEYSFVDVYPRTGRTHQIRIHFQSIGHPVLCDTLYASKRPCPEILGRLGLHAYSLVLPDESGEERRFTAPLPPEFKEFESSVIVK